MRHSLTFLTLTPRQFFFPRLFFKPPSLTSGVADRQVSWADSATGIILSFYIMWEGAVSLWEAREQFVAHLDGDEGLRLVRCFRCRIRYMRSSIGYSYRCMVRYALQGVWCTYIQPSWLRVLYLSIYKGSAWVPAGTHAPDRKIYPSAKSCD